MSMTDSRLAAAFVAAPDHWPRNGALARAIVLHMAEGGGTVSWLTRPDGNSSHYVVERSGRIVQMVAEADAAGSMNASLTRTTDDAPYSFEGQTITYGRSALNAAGIASDPNRYAIAIETEGFAKDGPSALQRHALKLLVADIRSRRGPLDVLGHRDQQDYKACPGHRVPWADYGQHGAATGAATGDDMPTLSLLKHQRWTANGEDGALRAEPVRNGPVIAKVPAGGEIISWGEYQPGDGNNWRVGEWPAGTGRAVWFLRVGVGVPAGHDFIPGDAIAFPQTLPVDATPYSQAELLAARAAGFAKATELAGTTSKTAAATIAAQRDPG